MAAVVYALCAVTSTFVAFLLIRGYRRNKARLQMWSCLCFIGLAINNLLLFVDLVVVPAMDLSLARQGTALVALMLLVIGLIWESR